MRYSLINADEGAAAVMDSGGGPMKVNGLLCSIKRAMTRCSNHKDLAQVIDKGTDEVDLKKAWTML